jgi:hypothetical protein
MAGQRAASEYDRNQRLRHLCRPSHRQDRLAAVAYRGKLPMHFRDALSVEELKA